MSVPAPSVSQSTGSWVGHGRAEEWMKALGVAVLLSLHVGLSYDSLSYIHTRVHTWLSNQFNLNQTWIECLQ